MPQGKPKNQHSNITNDINKQTNRPTLPPPHGFSIFAGSEYVVRLSSELIWLSEIAVVGRLNDEYADKFADKYADEYVDKYADSCTMVFSLFFFSFPFAKVWRSRFWGSMKIGKEKETLEFVLWCRKYIQEFDREEKVCNIRSLPVFLQ